MDPAVSRVRRNEHTTWISDDKHSRAYQVVFDERSDQIEHNLTGAHSPASQDARCLACHTTPRPAAVLKATSWMNSDGVGCESCHGASGRWLGPHTTYDWQRLEPTAKAAKGLNNTKDLALRTEVCAGCHVGAYSSDGLLVRDVNHDLIAAGHPRLNFELAAFLDNMPSHWEEKDQNAGPASATRRAPDFPARAWAIGRLATLKASLDLLHARAAQVQATLDQREKPAAGAEPLPEPLAKPSAGVAAGQPAILWPEFSEYNCFSCHHDLRDQAWRRRPPAGAAGLNPGTPQWGSWTLPLVSDLIEQLVPRSVAQPYTKALIPLSQEMARPVPNPRTVQERSRKVVELLDRCLETLASKRFNAAEVQRLIDRLDRRDAWDGVTSWDEAAQLYLALVPLRQARAELDPDRKADPDQLQARLEELLGKLQFPAGFDSPRSWDPTRLRMGQ
jgi:hypothetical protein